MRAESLDKLCRELDLPFSDVHLLRAAFTHSSYKNEHRQKAEQDNERLEFLGDAVLGLLVGRYLFDAYPLALEGDLSRMRAAIVCESSLVAFARELRFQNYLRLGRGEEQSGGRDRSSLLADVCEAFIGALFIDQGLDAADAFLRKRFYPRILDSEALWRRDYKTVLQERVQRRGLGELAYHTVEERGPAHEREFVVRVTVGGEVCGQGVGRSKKEAEQQAAEQALRAT